MHQYTLLLIKSGDLGWTDLSMTLRSRHDISIVGEAASTCHAIQLATSCQPGMIMAAAILERKSTLPLLIDLRRKWCPTSRIIVFATHCDPDELLVLAEMGITDYLLWSDLSSEMLGQYLDTLIGGDIVIKSRRVVQVFLAAQRRRLGLAEDPVLLTTREYAILQQLADGLTREQIAVVEGLSLRTVKRTIATLEVKLDAANPFVLGMKAAQLGLIQPRKDADQDPTRPGYASRCGARCGVACAVPSDPLPGSPR